jgi:hypothetical protein
MSVWDGIDRKNRITRRENSQCHFVTFKTPIWFSHVLNQILCCERPTTSRFSCDVAPSHDINGYRICLH